ncbi:MAG: hypothetical protein PVF74_04915 [Anaerolineales bacterium]|jgi:hypothetical protein
MTRSFFQKHLRRAILLFPVILLACNMFITTPITRDIVLGDQNRPTEQFVFLIKLHEIRDFLDHFVI